LKNSISFSFLENAYLYNTNTPRQTLCYDAFSPLLIESDSEEVWRST